MHAELDWSLFPGPENYMWKKNYFFGENKSPKLIFKWKFVGEKKKKKPILRLAIALTVKLKLACDIIELVGNWYVLLSILILL